MSRNEGRADRIVRFVLGAALVVVGIVLSGGASLWGGALAGVVGIVLLVTGAFGFCPAYCLLGIRTCPVKI